MKINELSLRDKVLQTAVKVVKVFQETIDVDAKELDYDALFAPPAEISGM